MLARRTKRNPVLIGEAGVGKTAIIEGLAQRIVAGEVPESLKGKRIMALDLAGMLAGAGVRGEFETRLKGVVKDAEDAKDVILFVDEIHMLVGAGRTGSDAMDASNILKPMLAKGALQFCGATTLNEYRQSVEKDGALQRRFQAVYVPEPSLEDCVSILRGLKDKYELHHRITIRDSAVVAAAVYAKRYFTDRKLPDKAIDLLDEAASRLCMQLESKPDAIASLERAIMTAKIEVEALSKDDDPATAARRERLQRRVDNDSKQLDVLVAEWSREKRRREGVTTAKQRLEGARNDLTTALQRGDFARAGQLKHVDIPALEKELAELAAEVAAKQGQWQGQEQKEQLTGGKGERGAAKGGKAKGAGAASASSSAAAAAAASTSPSPAMSSVLLREYITDEDVGQVVARHTGIPTSKLLLKERDRLMGLEEHLEKRVIGQRKAVEAVANCIRIARAGLHAHTKPQGVFLFMGPSGVGKTELSKALAEFLFDSQESMVRVDMSEYMEMHSVARMIGAPPGYIGHEEGGQLTEAVRRRPYQVVLLDEVEKAHRSVLNVLLQVFDEGFLTDGLGRRVDFRSTIVCMTSNLGAAEALEAAGTAEERQFIMEAALKRHFPPELVNRIDEVIVFNQLGRDSMLPIVEIQLRGLQRLLSEKRIVLDVAPEVKAWLAEVGFQPEYGARPLKRAVHTHVLQPLSQALLTGSVLESSHVSVTLAPEVRGQQRHLVFKMTGPVEADEVAGAEEGYDSEGTGSFSEAEVIEMR